MRDSKAGRQVGLTMIETLIALVIGLFVIGVAFVIYQQLTAGQKVSHARQNLSTIRSAVKELYQHEGSYTFLDNTMAIRADMVPTNMITGPASLVNTWGGSVTISVDPVDSSRFDITSAGIPRSACMHLGVFLKGAWDRVLINGTPVDGTVGKASASCAGGGNTIIYTAH